MQRVYPPTGYSFIQFCTGSFASGTEVTVVFLAVRGSCPCFHMSKPGRNTVMQIKVAQVTTNVEQLLFIN